MTAYAFTMNRFSRDVLTEVVAAGLPAPLALSSLGRTVTLMFDAELRAAEVTTLGAVVAAHNPAETLYARMGREWRELYGVSA